MHAIHVIKSLQLSEYEFFLDIDECELGMDDCENGTTFCSNTIGFFECLCQPGYIDPNGTSCQRKLSLKQLNIMVTIFLLCYFLVCFICFRIGRMF